MQSEDGVASGRGFVQDVIFDEHFNGSCEIKAMPLFGRKKKRRERLSHLRSVETARSSSVHFDKQTPTCNDVATSATTTSAASFTLSPDEKVEADGYGSPRVHRSRSAGDAYQLKSQLFYASAPAALALSSFAIAELLGEELAVDFVSRAGKQEFDENVCRGDRTEKSHRASRSSTLLTKVVEEDHPKMHQQVDVQSEAAYFPWLHERQRAQSLKEAEILDRQRQNFSREARRATVPSRNQAEHGAENSPEFVTFVDGLSSGVVTSKAKRKSVNLVPPSQMTVRRSNSEKMSPEESSTLKEVLTPRRSTISTFRKSMPSLLLTKDLTPSADETTVESAEQGSSETHQGSSENRKSGSSATSGCLISPSLESVAFIPCDNSSPKAAGESIKVSDSSELPANISKSKNARFHKLFKSVPTDEYPLDSFSCAFKGDILLQGMMYVSQNWICFYSKIRARGRLLEIPLAKVISITREKLALFIPNAIGIQVADQKYVFGSFMSRDNTYKLLLTLWKLSQDTANKPVRSLCNGKGHVDDITHSADISCESDTSEDDSHEAQEISEGAPCASAFLQSAELSSGHEKKFEQRSVRKSPVLSTVRCIDCWKIFTAFSTFAVKIQKIPRTNLLLAVCCILVLFLFLSAMGLTYKILLLQTQLEMSNLWTSSHQKSFREQVMGSMYTLQSESHMATIHQLHDVLKANIQVLEQVHRSLKSLQGFSTLASPQDCPTKK